MGRIFAASHKLPEAVDEFSQALRYDPTNSNAHNDLGVALFQYGDYEKAAEQFNDAIQIDPSDARARVNLALAQAQLKNKRK